MPYLDIPQDMAFISVLYKFANQHKIKYILNGGNISTECVLMPLEILYWGTDLYHVKDILNKFSTVNMKSYPFTSIFYHKFYLKFFKRIKVFKPLNFMPFNKNEAISELQKIYNWKPYPQKHFESRFTKFFESYWLPTRFDYDMRRNQFSSLILTGQMNRSDAIKELQNPSFDKENISKEIDFIASKLGISSDELMSYHSLPKKFYWDYKNHSKIFEIGEKILRFSTKTQRGGAY